MIKALAILTVAAVVSFSSSSAMAAPSFGAQVQKFLDTKISVWRCGQETDAVRAEVRATFVRGLANLRVINKKLIEARFAENAANSLKIVCGKPFSLFPINVYAYYFNGIFGRKIHLGDDKNRSWLKSEGLNAGVVFHEFLHFLNFDSVEKAQHNSGILSSDAVYMCAIAAFPELTEISSQSFFDFFQKDPNFAKKLCASARIVGGKVVIPKADVSRIVTPLLPASIRERFAN